MANRAGPPAYRDQRAPAARVGRDGDRGRGVARWSDVRGPRHAPGVLADGEGGHRPPVRRVPLHRRAPQPPAGRASRTGSGSRRRPGRRWATPSCARGAVPRPRRAARNRRRRRRVRQSSSSRSSCSPCPPLIGRIHVEVRRAPAGEGLGSEPGLEAPEEGAAAEVATTAAASPASPCRPRASGARARSRKPGARRSARAAARDQHRRVGRNDRARLERGESGAQPLEHLGPRQLLERLQRAAVRLGQGLGGRGPEEVMPARERLLRGERAAVSRLRSAAPPEEPVDESHGCPGGNQTPHTPRPARDSTCRGLREGGTRTSAAPAREPKEGIDGDQEPVGEGETRD